MKTNSLASSNISIESINNQSKQQIEKNNVIEKQQDEQQKALIEGKKKELTKEEADHIVKGINEFLQPKFTSLSFKLHEDLDRYYVEVVDQNSKEVIREIPSKELLDMYAKMTEFLGLFIDKKL